VLVVEGYMDVVALAQFGVGNAVATLGTATTVDHIHKLFRQTDRIVFCFDGDRAGTQGRLARARIRTGRTDRRTQRVLPVPADRTRPGQLRARIRRTSASVSRRCPPSR
jgi:DNA primase